MPKEELLGSGADTSTERANEMKPELGGWGQETTQAGGSSGSKSIILLKYLTQLSKFNTKHTLTPSVLEEKNFQ